MNTNSSKRHQVVFAENKTDIKKSKIDELHQNSTIGENETFKGGDFSIVCQDSAQKFLQDKPLHTFNCSTDPGN